MKAIFKFSLPEEQEEYNIFKQGLDTHNIIWEFRNFLRNREKHVDLSDEAYKELEIISEHFWQILDDNNFMEC